MVHVIIAPISQKNFEQMAEAMQQPELKTDVRFATVRRVSKTGLH
jgi:crotonobetainyl-CoA:carnitine CoA-transferase CaiB-like acyl-CoA transferase